jgi:regulator of protease activity HflC (stomatin/prohibitin superfamily)
MKIKSTRSLPVIQIVAGIVGLIIVMIVMGGFFSFVKIGGDEVGVVQDWVGVKEQVLRAGTHIYNNFIEDVHVYKIGTQKSTFGPLAGQQGEYPPISVEIGENGGQSAGILISVNYHLDATKVVTLYKQGLADTYEQVVLNREIVDTVNEVARPKHTALDIYSGAGFNAFKSEVDERLKNNSVLEGRGIIVENTIISGIQLDPEYKKQIDLKQIAQQNTLRAIEEAKAAEEEAKKVKAVMQSEVERRTQEANAKKAEQVLHAEAEGASLKAIAEGQRDARIAQATGDLALGKAEAEVQKLKTFSQYEGEAGARRAEVEIQTKRAEIMARLLEKVTVLPEKTFAQLGTSSGILSFGVDQASK